MAVKALGMFNQLALAQHAGVIVGLLKDSDSEVRYYALQTLGKLAVADLAPHAGAIEDMPHRRYDTWVRALAAQTLELLKPVSYRRRRRRGAR